MKVQADDSLLPRILPDLVEDWSLRGARFHRKIARKSVFKRESSVSFLLSMVHQVSFYIRERQNCEFSSVFVSLRLNAFAVDIADGF
jgi:hypothetical protein